jgi:low affinity Fe/Cu permease
LHNSAKLVDASFSKAFEAKGEFVEQSPIPQLFSRVLHWVGELTSRASAAVVAATVLLIFILVSAFSGFPGKWQTVFSTVASSITLVMLFVIQHTQSRQQTVLQLKLDELIRTSPQADDLLVHLEVAEDAELIQREESQVAHHEALREPNGDEK